MNAVSLLEPCLGCGRPSLHDFCEKAVCQKKRESEKVQWDAVFSRMDNEAKDKIRDDMVAFAENGATVHGRRLMPVRVLELFGSGTMSRRYLDCSRGHALRVNAIDTDRNARLAAMDLAGRPNFKFRGISVQRAAALFRGRARRIDMAWLDYCGNWGRERREDISALMGGALSDPALLFVSVKFGRQQDGTEYRHQVWEVPLEVMVLGRDSGVVTVPFFRKKYVGGWRSRMVVFGFHLSKGDFDLVSAMRSAVPKVVGDEDFCA